MKAVRLHEFGGPEVLKYEDAPRPVAAKDEVLVRVHAASLNPPDLYLRDGYGALPPEWQPLVVERWKDQPSLSGHLLAVDTVALIGRWHGRMRGDIRKYDATNERDIEET